MNVQVHRVSQALIPEFCIWGFRQLQMEMVEMGLSLVIIRKPHSGSAVGRAFMLFASF